MVERSRAAILLSNEVNFLNFPKFLTHELVTVLFSLRNDEGEQEVIIASSNLPSESNTSPTDYIVKLFSYCKRSEDALSLNATLILKILFGVVRRITKEVLFIVEK